MFARPRPGSSRARRRHRGAAGFGRWLAVGCGGVRLSSSPAGACHRRPTAPRMGLGPLRSAPGTGPRGSIAAPVQPQPAALEGTDVTRPTAGPEYSWAQTNDRPGSRRAARGPWISPGVVGAPGGWSAHPRPQRCRRSLPRNQQGRGEVADGHRPQGGRRPPTIRVTAFVLVETHLAAQCTAWTRRASRARLWWEA